MRTVDDFNRYYATPDPWGVSRATFRDRVLRRHLTRPTRNRSVLELGCGEGHLTQAVFRRARFVNAVDISNVAIARAKLLNLPNARFQIADLLDISLAGYDVIAAIECIYYLSHEDQILFLKRVAREHSGKMLLLSGPIIDYQRYFGHKRLMYQFKELGFTVVKIRNLSVYWHPVWFRIVANLLKLPLGHMLLDWLPERMIYQRLYVVRAPNAG